MGIGLFLDGICHKQDLARLRTIDHRFLDRYDRAHKIKKELGDKVHFTFIPLEQDVATLGYLLVQEANESGIGDSSTKGVILYRISRRYGVQDIGHIIPHYDSLSDKVLELCRSDQKGVGLGSELEALFTKNSVITGLDRTSIVEVSKKIRSLKDLFLHIEQSALEQAYEQVQKDEGFLKSSFWSLFPLIIIYRRMRKYLENIYESDTVHEQINNIALACLQHETRIPSNLDGGLTDSVKTVIERGHGSINNYRQQRGTYGAEFDELLNIRYPRSRTLITKLTNAYDAQISRQCEVLRRYD